MKEFQEAIEKLGYEFDPHGNNSPIKGEKVREISMEDFIKSHYGSSIVCYKSPPGEYRQVWPKHLELLNPDERDQFGRPETQYVQSIRFMVYSGKVVGVSESWHAGRFRFWVCGCDHDLKETNLGGFLHKYTCTKCGYTYTTDSSD